MGGDAVGGARLGDGRRGSVRQRAAGAHGRPAREGGGALGAHLRDGQPGCAADDRAAGKHRRPRDLLARSHLGGDGDRGDRRPRGGLALGGEWTARPGGGGGADRRDRRADARAREHAHAGRRHRHDAGADGRVGPGGTEPRRLRPSRRGTALQRGRRARRPGARACGSCEHGGGQPEQGTLRADGGDPRRPRAGDRARARDAAAARRRERAQGRHRGRGGARRARHARRPARRRSPAGA